MKALTLDEAREQIAHENAWETWEALISAEGPRTISNCDAMAAELFAQSKAAQAWEQGYNVGFTNAMLVEDPPVNPYQQPLDMSGKGNSAA